MVTINLSARYRASIAGPAQVVGAFGLRSFSVLYSAALILALAFCIAGCAPSLGRSVRVDLIPDLSGAVERQLLDKSPGPLAVDLQAVRDDRAERAMIKHRDTRIDPDGSVTGSVKVALRKRLRAARVNLDGGSGVALTATIKRWQAELNVGFPVSSVRADAEIEVELRDLNGQVRYLGTYTGFSSLEHPRIEDRLGEVLGDAIGQSLDQLILDQGFVDQLRVSQW